MRLKSVAVGATVLALSVALLPAPVSAAPPVSPGTTLSTLTPTPSGNGRAIAIDPVTRHIFYTNAGQASIFVIDTSGHLVNTLEPGIVYGALSWDPTNRVLWGGRYDGSGRIDEISPTTGAVTPKFAFSFPVGDSCYSQGPGFIDGLAFDSTDGTLWLSDDNARTVFHVTTTGTTLSSFTVPDGKCNTGIASFDGTLFLAEQSGPDQGPYAIVSVAKSDPTAVVGSIPFTTGQGPEGIAIDFRSFVPNCALWVNQFGSQTVLTALALQPGCRLQPGPPTSLSVWATTLSCLAPCQSMLTAQVTDASGQPVGGVPITFEVVRGRDAGRPPISVRSNASGLAMHTFTSPTPDVDIVRVTFTDASGNKVTSSVIESTFGGLLPIAFTPSPRTTAQVPPPASQGGPQNSNIGLLVNGGSSCTATLVAPSVVLTSAHCSDGKAHSLFAPGFSGDANNCLTNNSCSIPFGIWTSSTPPIIPAPFFQGNQDFDFMFVVLDTDPSGRSAAALAGDTPVLFNDPATKWRVVGYFALNGGPDFQDSCAANGNILSNMSLFINCSLTPGQLPGGTSGGPWFDGNSVVAVNKAGGKLCAICSQGMFGVRLTDAQAQGQTDPNDAGSLYRQASGSTPQASPFTRP